MYLFEGRITLENRPLIEEYLNSFDYKASGLTFTSMFMWKEVNRFSWEIIGDYLCVTCADNLDPDLDDTFMLPPLTRTGHYDPIRLKETILEAKSRFDRQGIPFAIRLVPFHMLDFFRDAMPNELVIEADRANFDYVYDTKDLIELAGRAYHPKKNHLNYFHSHYEYEYGSMTSAMAEEGMEFIRAFNERKNLQDPHEKLLLEFEERAMRDVFYNIEAVGYLTGVIRIGGKMEAISIGGRLGKKTVVVHVEKANTEYRGLYQAINNEFCKAMASNVKRINREEDMGIPGLRKAKLSYHPVKFIEKYSIVVK